MASLAKHTGPPPAGDVSFFDNKLCSRAVDTTLFKKISEAAIALDYPCYVIGGYVRDLLMERPSKDIDVVCVGSGIALAKKVDKIIGGKNDLAVYKKFGTAMLKTKLGTIEFVGARKESYRANSRKPIVEDGTLDDDLNRRDFTINAMAISLNAGSYGMLVDKFDGMTHLKKKVIKTPLDPNVTFSDDPLRIMRAIRFATQLRFSIDEITLLSIHTNKDRIKIVSQERITEEINKIILSPEPSIGFKLLFGSGLLDIIFPEMTALQGVEVKEEQAHKDNFFHTLQVLDNLSLETNDLWLRWSAVLHDIAKPPTKRFDIKIGWTFHGHDALGAQWVPKIFKKMKLPLDDKMKYVQKLVALHLRPIGLAKKEVTDSGIRRLLFDAGDAIDDLMLLCRADITSKNEEKVKRYLKNFDKVVLRCVEVEETDKLRNWQPPVTGEMIMKTFGISPSKKVGIIKDAIRDAILDGDIPNEQKAAAKLMLSEGEKLGLVPKK